MNRDSKAKAFRCNQNIMQFLGVPFFWRLLSNNVTKYVILAQPFFFGYVEASFVKNSQMKFLLHIEKIEHL